MSEEALFELALRTPTAERAALLDRVCDGRPDVRARVEALLQAGSQSVVTAAISSFEATTSNKVGDFAGIVIAGRYKLLEEIGEGGMGTVFVAEQTEPVKRKVAVKLIKPGMDSKSVLARFEAERQALAMMDHPNIAKVLDAGLTEKRRPYFVMEYIKGLPLTKYCDDVKLSIDERLKLFIQICQAVQHAHQKGIIHRDLKPGNILIALYDGKPVPKVIDFGLAKALHHSLTERTLHTGHEMVLGTPLYMSPEQAELNNLDIDTRSDIYSLGVILYELLTGVTPLEKQRFKEAAWAEVVRIIKEEEPSKPSTKLSHSASLPSVAAQRQMEPKKLSSLMKGDLDWIVMKALEKDRNRRYETANGFAADVLRYLSGEAVTAVPPSAGYRFKKFVKRNKGKVVAGGMIMGLLLAGITGTTVGLIRAMQATQAERIAKQDAEEQKEKALHAAKREADERRKADAAKLEAQAKEAEATAVVKFFEEEVFAAARPKGQDGGLGAEVTLRNAIVASVPALEKGFANQPLVEARLRNALGITFSYLSDYELARNQFERARSLFILHRGPDHPDTLMNMNNLASSYAALNRPADALKLREETLAIQKRVLPPDHPDMLMSMHNLANSYVALNRPADALKLREETLAIQKRVLPPDHPDTLMSMHNLANSYAALNRPADALKLREETLAIRKRVLPANHPDTLLSMNNLAVSYANQNRLLEALKLREETLAIRKQVLPPNHPDTLMSMNNLANSYAAMGRREAALQLNEETLEIQKRVLSPGHQDTLRSMHNLANSYAALNRPADAHKLHEETLAIRKMMLHKDHPDTLASMINLAVSLIQLNRGGEAIPLLDEAIAIARTNPTVNARLIPHAIGLRMKHFYKTGDAAGCRATAEMWENLNNTGTIALYDSARHRAVAAGVQAKAQGANALQLAQADADRAMQWLHQAVQAGFMDITRMRLDSDLDPLRERADFKKLIAELEKTANKQ